MRELAYLHPAAMVTVLILGVWVLREGLKLRRSRLRREPRDPRRHMRLARVFVPLVLIGYGAGLASMAFLRDRAILESVHAVFASLALVGFITGAVLGGRLARGAGLRLRAAHLLAGSLALLFGLGSVVAGLAILP